MTDVRLMRKFNGVTSRLQHLRAVKLSLLCWTVTAIVLCVMLLRGFDRVDLFKVIAVNIPVSIGLSIWAFRSRLKDRRQAALLLETTFPELDSMLFASLEQKPVAGKWEFGFLQSELLSQVLDHARCHDWNVAVAGLTHSRLSRIVAMLTCLLLAWFTPVSQPAPLSNLAAAVLALIPETAEQSIGISVEPGDVEIERGSSLLVLARFGERLPQAVTLVASDLASQQIRIPLRKSLDDPIYGGRIPEVMQDMIYHIEYDQLHSDEYSVTTFTYPELLKADAKLGFPDYTGLSPETVEDVRRLSVVEGTEIQFDLQLNKPLATAVFVDESGARIAFQPDEGAEMSQILRWEAGVPQKKTFRLEMTDRDGRANRDVPEFVIQVLPNNPANLKVAFPARDVRVSPLEELSLQANASDDFGLVEFGLVYETPTGDQEFLKLGENAGRDEKTTMEHLLHVETLKVVPDQLISYYFYADDIGPDGAQRRAFSDIFFSEVRHFEEIFREVPPNAGQPPQPQQQGEGESGQLLEVQRQIVTATWNLIRAESRTEPSKNFLPTAQVLFESQEKALEMGGELKEKLEDEQLQRSLDEALELMTSTSRFFADAIAKNHLDRIHDARSKAQAAYQALLRLNSQEKQVQQSQQSQSKSQNAQQQDRNRQMQTLELKNDRDRYETERQAQQQQQQQAERETLQVLNRLRELARRQEDLNEKIRDLENKLREAKDEQEKADLGRDLKRLQEEQEDLLRNLDELRERMNQEENRERMSEAREQVTETRERVLRASEALKQDQTSRALTEGTRAERELNELKEEFKIQTASQFEDAVRGLRDEVRELSENQNAIEEAMERKEQTGTTSARKSLRPTEDTKAREDVAKQLEAQQTKLTNVLDRTKELVEESENTEPLLSKKLYDTMRDIRKFEPEEALKGAAQLQRYGIEEEARKAQAQAQQGIRRLEKGVEEAARAILGEEGEALAGASNVLEELIRAIESELQANAPAKSASPEQAKPGQADPVSPGNSPPDESSSQQAQKEQSRTPSSQALGQANSDAKPSTQQSKSAEENSKTPQNSASNEPQNSDEPHGASEVSPSSVSSAAGDPMVGPPGESSPSSSESGKPGPGEQQTGTKASQAAGQNQSQPGQGEGKPNLGQQIGSLFQQGGSENGGGNLGPGRPLTGDEYREWSDRMRDLEEMVTTPELRTQVATIRDRARQVRLEMQRHSKAPDWGFVRTSIYGPMVELQQVIAEELARRDPQAQLVPIDRDPVPDQYTGLLQKYYEELARQKSGK